jgi:hypothetical protein
MKGEVFRATDKYGISIIDPDGMLDLYSAPMPAQVGDLDLLNKYLNLHPAQAVLFIAWISYTLAHPKLPASKFVILVLQGGHTRIGHTSSCQSNIITVIKSDFQEIQYAY